MDLKIVLALMAVLAVGYLFSMRGGKGASGSDARKLVAEGAMLLDVRTPGEFRAGHVPGAINIPVQELDERLRELDVKERPIVVYCRSGVRSRQAKGILERAGHRAVHDLGAMSRW